MQLQCYWLPRFPQESWYNLAVYQLNYWVATISRSWLLDNITSMQTREEVRIGQFISDPGSLKVLILAGISIEVHELKIIAKCSSLIKLDLSSNFLSDVPLRFHIFPSLKILYLHENNISNIELSKTSLQYVSLFSNPIQEYRHNLIAANPNIIGVDFNVVTATERAGKALLMDYTLLKWPIIQISTNLQSEDEYLNLFRAQIFVITTVHRRAQAFETSITYLKTILTCLMHPKGSKIRNVVKHWISFTQKRRKLRKFLADRGKEWLIYNRIKAKLHLKGPQVVRLILKFSTLLKERVNARRMLLPKLLAYNQYTREASHIRKYLLPPEKNSFHAKLYFKNSQIHFLDKIFLYAKRLFFDQKNYDLCDNFHSFIVPTNRHFFIFRNSSFKSSSTHSFIMDCITSTRQWVLKEKGLDRQKLLYEKKGLKKIIIKSINPPFTYQLPAKCYSLETRLAALEAQYQLLIEYAVNSKQLYEKVLKIIRYFNAGNFSSILSNQAAYFKTQVVFQEFKPMGRLKLYCGLEFYVKRVVAANILQRWWRRMNSTQNCPIKTVEILRRNRANRLISKWFRSIIFFHRLKHTKIVSRLKSSWSQRELYMQLEVYMGLPNPTDFLRKHLNENVLPAQKEIYLLLHYNTQVQLVDLLGRRWVKIIYPNLKAASLSMQKLIEFTYRYYYGGFWIQLFTKAELSKEQSLRRYQEKVKTLYGINITMNQMQAHRKMCIDNRQAFFLWPEAQGSGINDFFGQIKQQVFPINFFVFNKHRRYLKVECNLICANPPSFYKHKKICTHRVKPPRSIPHLQEREIPYIIRYRRRSVGKKELMAHCRRKQPSSQLQNQRGKSISYGGEIGLLSHTLNIRMK